MRILVAIILLAAFAGCLEADDTDVPLEQAEPGMADVAFRHDSSGCTLGAAVVVNTMEHFASFLPDGFAPADAQVLLGTPAPTGFGAAVFSMYRCDDGTLTQGPFTGTEINIAVQDPGLDNATHVTTHYYLAWWGTDDADLISGAAELGIDVEPVTFLPLEVLEGYQFYDFSQDEEGNTVFGLVITAAAPQTLEGTSRFWHVTPNGTAWIDYVIGTELLAGAYDLETGPGLAQDIAAPLLGDMVPETIQGAGLLATGFDWVSTGGVIPA